MPKGASKKDEFEGEEKKVRATKKAKAKRPKGASSAYNIYVAEHRATLAAADPSLTFGDLSKRVSADWKLLSEAQRRVRTAKKEREGERRERWRERDTHTQPSRSLFSL